MKRPRRSEVAVPPLLRAASEIGWRFLVSLLALVAIVFILVRLRVIVIPVLIALFLTTMSAPPATWLKEKGWPSALATWLVMLAAVGVVSGIIYFIVPRFISQLDQLTSVVQQGIDQVTQWLRTGPLSLNVNADDFSMERVARFLRTHVGAILGGALLLLQMVAALLLALVLTFFFTHDGPGMWSWFRDRFSDELAPHVDEMGRRSWQTLGAYVRGTAIVGLIDAVGIGIALYFIGVPLILPLMVLTFFGAFFPFIGAFVAGILASLVALVSGGFVDALLVAGSALIVQQIEGNLLQPVIVGRTVRLHPVAVILAISAGGILAGIAGAFIAVPALAVAMRIGSYMRDHREEMIPRYDDPRRGEAGA